MKILIIGKNGQVGYELQRSLQCSGKIIGLDRSQMDISNPDQIRSAISQIKPNLIINAAAYTAVDKAEIESDLAMRINGTAPGVIAEEALRIGATVIHYSTDYVFDGSKKSPYEETDVPCPINVYGHTKLAGEQAIQLTGVPYLILRTSWVYGARGKNFLNSITQIAREKDEIRIVDDQYGAPTWSRTIADATAQIVSKITTLESVGPDISTLSGIYHLTAQGETTWYGFANEFLSQCETERPKLIPIASEDYPTPAKRPKNSRLSSEKLMKNFCVLPDWKGALQLCQRK